MPFATPALYPARIETTREQLRARFRAGTALRRYTGLDRLVIHETIDPEVVRRLLDFADELDARVEAAEDRARQL